jgi:uncharacterized protein with NAD-binding domain and iron-sulfur cluster
MAKKRIAILGGGIGGLSTACELTRTPELRERYDVTLYQLGWRLGGKCASSRNEAHGDRIEEHGLHIWLGCYDNAFALMREVLEERARFSGAPPRTLEEAFLPQSFTPIGLGDGSTFYPVSWPTNADKPGSGEVLLSSWGAITQCIGLLKMLVKNLLADLKDGSSPPGFLEATAAPASEPATDGSAQHVASHLEQAHREAQCVDVGQDTPPEEDMEGILQHIEEAQQAVAHWGGEMEAAGSNPKRTFLNQLLIVAKASLRGLWKLRSQGFNLDLIDTYDFRQWLVENGAPEEFLDLEKCSFLRALYDLPFAYRTKPGGLIPDFAAGAALRCVIRICATYKQNVLFEMKAGMGEAVIAPIYEVLKQRGVRFEFFRKVKRLELSADKKRVARVRMARQVKLRAEEQGYQPLIHVPISGAADKLPSWPSEPLWDQLEGSEELRKARPDFESHWCTWPEAGEVMLEAGADFDEVVLALPVGAFKELNPQDGAICAELMDASPAFRAMCEKLGQIPTLALQLWMSRDLKELGWEYPRPAANGAVEPVDVWADETHLIPLEGWDKARPPKSLHYFCGPLNTELYREPATQHGVPALARGQVLDIAMDWFTRNTGSIWPAAVDPSTGALDPAALYGGASTLKAGLTRQYVRANVDPTECCTTSLAGSTSYRLDPGASGFDNLYLAGSWTRTGFNAECVEGTVMSGMRAAQALSGVSRKIVGWNFMGPKDT